MALQKEQKNKIVWIYLPLLLFIGNLVLKLIFIEKRDVSIDEPFSIFHAQQSVSDIIALSSSGEPNPPTHLLLLHFWIKLFGNSAVSVRFLSLLFNSLTVVTIYFTGKKFYNRAAGTAASLLFIFSFYNFFHGLEARTYSMFVLATALSLYYFLSTLRKDNWFNILALVLSNILVVYSHYFGWFVIFVQFIGCLLFFNKGILRNKLLLTQFLTFIAFIPILLPVINQFKISSGGTWLNAPQLDDYIKELTLLLNSKQVAGLLILLLVVGAIYTGKQEVRKIILKKELLILFMWWFLPYTLMFLLSFKLPMFNSRYILFTSVGLYLFTAVLISGLFQRNTYIQRVLLTIPIIAMAITLRILPDDFGRREIEETVQFVKSEEKHLNNRVILLYPGWSDYPFMYYYDRDIFNQPYKYKELCVSDNIIKVWNSANLKEISGELKGKDLIMVVDRSEEDASIFFDILSSSHIKVSGGSFPETYSVGVFTAQSVN